MKTKYVKVPVSERLPEKEGCYPIILKNTDIIRDYYRGKNILSEEFWKIHIEYWLEEKEDHSEEMLSVLQRILDLNILPAEIDDEVISLTLKAQGYDMNQINEISQNGFERTKQLINKVKDNG
ncbi:hypothetical protein HZQ61_02905 [Elizabethkingia anophelis]|nr:hypothetical protein [Elizabethkingia anophelis]